MDEPTLLPCPFCGNEDVELDDQTGPSAAGHAFVWCDWCEATGPVFTNTPAAIAAWNRRAKESGDE